MENQQNNKNEFINNAKEAALHIGLLFLTIFISFIIFKPFLVPVVWGIIIAVALYPIFKKLTKLFKGRKGMAATFIVLFGLALLIIPTLKLAGTTIDGLQNLSEQLEQGSLEVPPPPDRVKDWPVIGDKTWELWNLAAVNIDGAIQKMSPQLKSIGIWLAGSISGLVGGFFIFIFALIISGIFMVYAGSGYELSVKVFNRLEGNKGQVMVDNSVATIRSVVYGVLGVAFIQAALVGLGFTVADIPGTPVLTLIVLLLAIVQIPPLLIVIPVIVYAFSSMGTGGAVVFAIWSILAGASDNFLKPLLLGRGVDIPMLVILIGAIGGMVAGGIIGMFVGAVILALAYQLFLDFMDRDRHDEIQQTK
ncbi:MAG: AI-2E family transporter [Cyclobacteriaceae bacterium]|nr:AI-2E family transporter [Cyclobacteriaceae bacterium]